MMIRNQATHHVAVDFTNTVIERILSTIIGGNLSVPYSLPRCYDLHSHTYCSDGYLSPTELVCRAVLMGVSDLAITDHDTVAGLNEAQQAIQQLQLSLRLINGVEISTCWQHHDIHILGLNIDLTHLALCEFLFSQQQKRRERAEEIALQLAKHRIPHALEGAERLAKGIALTRAHFASYLVEQGIAPTVKHVFKKYLAKGKIGYVAPQWCTMDQAIAVIHQAGGVAVLAHPYHYDLSGKWLRRLIVAFKQAGGDGLEVAQCQQTPEQRRQLGGYCEEYQLLASQGSDFHQPCAWIELGRRLQLPEHITPVWQDW